jgi:hypothetical protein
MRDGMNELQSTDTDHDRRGVRPQDRGRCEQPGAGARQETQKITAMK